VQDNEAEALHRAATLKRSKSAPSTGNDRCKKPCISAAGGFAQVSNTIGGVMGELTAAIRDATSSKNTTYSNAIATVVSDEAFSQNDMDNAFDIFTNNPRVAETYTVIPDASARTATSRSASASSKQRYMEASERIRKTSTFLVA
jgi:hypothetical protein